MVYTQKNTKTHIINNNKMKTKKQQKETNTKTEKKPTRKNNKTKKR